MSIKKNNLEEKIREWKVEITKLSYEESIDALDTLLNNLQNENVSLDDIEEYYVKGNIYLSHCQRLLQGAEQKITELDLEEFQVK